ncbi:aminopeptidase P family protein [Candidatus Thorarchaeota archaeon]|nr:MAG: aminopeptidase P family protein [Candidatus Thorarchaeota archaeon]
MQFTPQRLDRVHKALQKENMNTLVVTRRQDVQYLTGYHNPTDVFPIGCVLVQGEQPVIIMSELQYELAKKDAMMARIKTIDSVNGELGINSRGVKFWSAIQEVIQIAGVHDGVIGVQHDCLPIREFEYLKNILPQAGFKDAAPLLWRLRQVKDDAEIESIRNAVMVAEIGIRTAFEMVVPGVAEDTASIEIEAAMRAAGGQVRGIRAAVLSGGNARFPHAQPTPKRIGTDDLVVVDITVSDSGYFAEVARTLHTKKPSKAQNNAYESLLKMCSIAEEKLTPDSSIADVTNAMMKSIKKQPCQNNLIQPVGNSIGLDLHEPPSLFPENKLLLREGMVFSIHPTCYVKDIGCIRMADIMLITHDGSETITSLTRETM